MALNRLKDGPAFLSEERVLTLVCPALIKVRIKRWLDALLVLNRHFVILSTLVLLIEQRTVSVLSPKCRIHFSRRDFL